MNPMRYPHIAGRLFNTPLLIVPEKLDAIIAGLSGRLGVEAGAAPEAFVSLPAEKREPGYQVIDGVAVIDVFGVLVHRSRMEADSTFLLGYQEIAQRIDAALADAEVRALLLNIDSPGGEVAGCFDLVQHIRDARGVKPIHAVASDMACSAAYAIASAAETLSLTRTAQVGSIGVVARHVDFSRMMDKKGVTITHIYAGAHKVDGNPYEPLPESVRERFQAEINNLHELFVTTVADNRGLSPEHVRGTEAGVFTGQAGIDARLADRIETPDQMIQRLASEYGQPGSTRAIAAQHTGDKSMSDQDKKTPPAAVTPDADENALAQAREQGRAEALAEIEQAAAQAREDERARIQAIVTSEASEGRTEMAYHLAFATDMDAEQALALLEKSPKAEKEGGNAFAAAMAGLGNPDLGADGDGGQDDAAAEAQRIVSLLDG